MGQNERKHPVGSIGDHADHLARHHTYLTRQLESLYADKAHTFTCERANGRLSERTQVALWDAGEDHLYAVWSLDAMLWTIEQYREGHYTHALRGYAQACGYFGRMRKPTPDAMVAIRNALEAVTEYVVARETDCRCGVRLIDCRDHFEHESRLAKASVPS